MQIQAFTESLLERLKSFEQSPSENDVITAGKNLSAIRDIVAELKTFTSLYKFNTTDEEIAFFKMDKPVIMSHYYYHRKLLSLKLFNTFRDQKSILAKYDATLRKMKRLIDRNRDFYEYCISGDSYLDQLYFTRSKSNPIKLSEDENFSTGYDVILAKFLSYELIRGFIIKTLEELKSANETKQTGLTWTGAKTDLIELSYALQAAAVFNNGTADIRSIVAAVERLFSVNLGNYYRVFLGIRIRKNGQTAFLDELKEKLVQKINTIER